MEGSAGRALVGPYVWGAPLHMSAEPPERLGATIINNSRMTPEQSSALILEIVKKKIQARAEMRR